MIFQFPDLDTFRLAVTSAQVPPEVSAAPAEVSFDPEGRPSVRSAAGIPPKPMQNALKKLGVKSSKEHYSETVLSVDCWPQVLPVAKHAGVPEVTANTAVLFEMPLAEMPAVVSEMLRLGNDRQSFRTLAASEGQNERVLLKVIGPPYYTLLRAIDKSTQKDATVTAYLEKSPRVWVEIGHQHPLAMQIKPAEGQVLLLRPEREWSIVQDGQFQDVYEVLDFKLPTTSVEWQESRLKKKLDVPLRLVPGNAADVAEMWVLTENAVDQLDAFVRDADERLMARLLFAVVEEGERKSIILKTRPSKLSPPVLSLEKAQGFKPFWKLPNLFLPVGSRIMPTLRRDAIRKLLAEDPAQVVWLMPKEEGKFTREFLPDDAFRPLEDWTDYIIDHEHEAVQAWMQATRFDFDSFVCSEDQPDRPKGPPSEKGKRNKKGSRDESADDLAPAPVATKGNKRKAPTPDEADVFLQSEALPPNEVKLRLRELEKEFLEHPGSLDADERQAIWPEMARLNTLDGRELEAAICWTNAFWELPEVPEEGAWAWLHGEDRRAQRVPTAEEFDSALAIKLPSPNEVRRLAARVVHACRLSPLPRSLIERLPPIRDYLEKNEGAMGTRAVWLAWWHLAQANGPADVLILARVRVRLLQRLLTEGLNKERDLPYFLRVAGEQNSERIRQVRDRAMRVHKLVEKWQEDVKVNKPYVELMFAFGLAKLGEVTAARDLMKSAGDKLLEKTDKGSPDPAHEFLLKAFVWRIENAIQGKAHAGPLPAEMMARIETLDDGRNNQASKRYIVDRLRQHSWILEPQEKIDAYGPWKKHGSELHKALADLANVKEPARLEEAIKKLVRSNQSPENRLHIFSESVSLAPRAGENFCTSLIQQVPAVLDASNRIAGTPEHLAALREKETQLLERSLFLAAHYDRMDQVQALFGRFFELVKLRNGIERYDAINKIARVCLRGLRKLGLRDEIDQFLQQMMELILQGKSLSQLRLNAGSNWPDLLGALLHLAEGWMFFGGFDKAKPFLDEARSTLFENVRLPKEKTLKPQQLTKLMQTYVTTLGQGPVDEALNRIEELFVKVEKLPNGFTTSTHFSRLHLNVVEDVVRSLINENMGIGDQARRWMDDDEYLVRRRIHADMKKLLSQSGLS